MKFSLQWVRDYVDPGPDPEALGARLTAVGLPMDSLERVGDDVILDFDVTTNRPDCMNHLGLAREIAVATEGSLKEPSWEVEEASAPPAERLGSLDVEAPDLCGRYTARILTGVRVGPSPDWLSRRLVAIGLRPINSVVDATNYVLWETGHPLHAFDLARLAERRIRVRRAAAGEPLTTLDGMARKLDPEMLVIADARRAVAVAGVMGGYDTEISLSTTEVLLESAHFDPTSIRKTARKLGLHTDASHRFERGADLEVTRKAADRCARLITQVAGGRIAPGVLEVRSAPPFTREIQLRPDRVRRLLGLPVPDPEMKRILERLGCSVTLREASRWRVSTPSFRGDLALEEDLVEEIARHHGYDRIPSTLPRVFVFPEGRSDLDRRLDRVRRAMLRCGFSEAINLSLVSARDNESLGESGPGIRVMNPLAEGQDRLRTTLLPGLLRNLAHNLNHGSPEVRLFETGKVFRMAASAGVPPEEEETLALVCGGKGAPKHWGGVHQAPDLFDLKGALDLAARLVGLPAAAWEPVSRPHLASGTGVELRLGGAAVGSAGELSPSLASARGLQEAAFVAEISLHRFFAPLPPGFEPRFVPLPRTPAVTRDLSLIVDEMHNYAEVEAMIRSVEGVPVVRVTLFDRYRGRPVPLGKVSMAVNLVFHSPGRTLVSGEIAGFLDRIVQRLRERLGAVLRGD